MVKPDQQSGTKPVIMRRLAGLAPYEKTVSQMEIHAGLIRKGEAGEEIWLVEHPPLYTAGTSARERDLLDPSRLPVFRSGRGGQYSYHGPGQRVAYVMLDLGRRGRDVRAFVGGLESWIIAALARLGVNGELRKGRVGVWVDDGGKDKKIAAIGVRIRRWVSFHGISVNVSPDLSHYEGIVPCGLGQYGVTSLADLGVKAGMDDLDEALAAPSPPYSARLWKWPGMKMMTGRASSVSLRFIAWQKAGSSWQVIKTGQVTKTALRLLM